MIASANKSNPVAAPIRTAGRITRHVRADQDLDRSRSTTEVFDDARSDYSAAKGSIYRRRRLGTLALGSTADWHYKVPTEYYRMVEQVRDMDRNDPVVGQTIDRSVENIFQEGFQLDPLPKDKGVRREIKARWREWADDPEECDIQGEATFNEIAAEAYRASKVDGDYFVLGTREGQLQVMESHRCRSPDGSKGIVHGIELDGRRRRKNFWFTKDDISPWDAFNLVDGTPVAARDADGYRQVFQIYQRKRPTQTRGVSAFIPVFDLLNYFNDINFAALVKQQVSTCFAIFRQREAAFDPEGQQPAPTGALTQLPTADGVSRIAQSYAPGMEVRGEPGEKLIGFSPQVPNPQWFEHMLFMLQLIGINLGLPLGIVLLKPEGNFSAWRGAVDQARMGWRCNQNMLVRRFYRPAYVWKLRQWIYDDPALDRAERRLGKDFYAHAWHRPTWPYIDPEADAKSDLLQAKNGLNSMRRIHAGRGRDLRRIQKENVDDNARAVMLAITRTEELEKQFGGKYAIDWREINSLPGPMLKPADRKPGAAEEEEKS
ncbi:MAG TPA: phage portal protein [Pirellulales bacterium]|nr:phage portal protein [Pirellulales bacterium]